LDYTYTHASVVKINVNSG